MLVAFSGSNPKECFTNSITFHWYATVELKTNIELGFLLNPFHKARLNSASTVSYIWLLQQCRLQFVYSCVRKSVQEIIHFLRLTSAHCSTLTKGDCLSVVRDWIAVCASGPVSTAIEINDLFFVCMSACAPEPGPRNFSCNYWSTMCAFVWSRSYPQFSGPFRPHHWTMSTENEERTSKRITFHKWCCRRSECCYAPFKLHGDFKYKSL